MNILTKDADIIPEDLKLKISQIRDQWDTNEREVKRLQSEVLKLRAEIGTLEKHQQYLEGENAKEQSNVDANQRRSAELLAGHRNTEMATAELAKQAAATSREAEQKRTEADRQSEDVLSRERAVVQRELEHRQAVSDLADEKKAHEARVRKLQEAIKE